MEPLYFDPAQASATALKSRVVDSIQNSNTLNLDLDPGYWPNLDPDPGLYYQFRKKKLQIILEKNNFL